MRIFFLCCVAVFSFLSCKTEINDVGNVPERGFHSNRPANIWEESLVTGNGVMGAMVMGDPYRESIVLNHALLYLPIHSPRKPVSQGKNLEKIQQMMLDGKYTEASKFIVDLANSEGYQGKHATDLFVPAFQFNISSDTSSVKEYNRTVDFTTGEVEVKWEDNNGIYSRKLFISRADNVVALRLSSKKGSIHTTLNLSQIMRHDAGRKKKFTLSEKNCIDKVESGVMENGLYFKAWYERPWEFESRKSFKGYEGVVKVVNMDGDIEMNSDQIVINGATDVLILARVEPSDNMEISKVPDMMKDLSLYPTNYAELLDAHKKIHKELFERVSIDLGASKEDRMKSSEELLEAGGSNPALIEKIFDAARYNVICATGINPPNLQGIWGATMTPPWSGDYTTNGNLPVVISHYLQANTPELMLPLFDRLEAYMEDFKVNARELYNCRGIHVPSRFSSHGLNNHFDATWPMTFWVTGEAYREVLDTLRRFAHENQRLDMLLTNFVYEKQGAKRKKVMNYRTAIPKGELIDWRGVRMFMLGQYILMHSVVYRTELLRECGLELPKHTFYVDNIFVYQPLPHVKSMYYLDVNFYRYYIGREDQSVNEAVMIGRIDQQIRVTKLMLGYYDVMKISNKKLRRYMIRYLEIMMTVSSILAIRSETEENLAKKKELWQYLKKQNFALFLRLRWGFLGQGVNLPGKGGRKVSIACYKISQKFYGFN